MGSVSLTIEMLETASAFERSLGRNETLNYSLLSKSNEPVTTFSGLKIHPDSELHNNVDFDAIYFPTVWALDEKLLHDNAVVSDWLVHQNASSPIILGLLTGSYFMAQSGLLDQRVATTHWRFADDFRERYPHVSLRAELLTTSDGNMHCAGSVAASMHLTMNLIQQACGATVAQQVERHCLMGYKAQHRWIGDGQADSMKLADRRIGEVLNWLEQNLSEPVSLDEVCARFGFSKRNLTRRFKVSTGRSLFEYIEHLRMQRAKMLLTESSLNIEQVAIELGYQSSTVFGRRFRRAFELTPKRFRQNHQKLKSNTIFKN